MEHREGKSGELKDLEVVLWLFIICKKIAENPFIKCLSTQKQPIFWVIVVFIIYAKVCKVC